MDLTKITTPFGLLDEDTQKALKGHGGPYERYTLGGWECSPSPNWYCDSAYRVQPQPPKPREWWIGLDGYACSVEPGAAPPKNSVFMRVREVLE